MKNELQILRQQNASQRYKNISLRSTLVLFISLFLISQSGFAQNVGIGTTTPDASAKLEVKSTDKGILIPRMEQTQIEAITSPANGLQVFNTDDGKLYIYVLANNRWKEVQYGSGGFSLPAIYTIGTGGSCVNTTVNGKYMAGVALDASNAVTLDASVTTPGHWSITTNETNGYSFSGSGAFDLPGTVQVTLYGTGTPVTPDQTDQFTATADGNTNNTCTFEVEVSSCGALLVYDGQSYATVEIGGQCWMAENLNIGVKINGSSDQTNNSTIEKYCYENLEVKCDTFGGFYQWKEMMQYSTTEGTRGICPEGWHLPSDAEWMTLEETLGMCSGTGSGCSGATGWRGTNEGSKMAGDKGLWLNGALEDDTYFNNSGLTVLPAGNRDINGSFYNKNSYTYLWTSSESGSNKALIRRLFHDHTGVTRYDKDKAYGSSVRCVRD